MLWLPSRMRVRNQWQIMKNKSSIALRGFKNRLSNYHTKKMGRSFNNNGVIRWRRLSVFLKGLKSISCFYCCSGLSVYDVCVWVCVYVGGYTVGKLSRRDADCVESQQLQTPETHSTSLSLSLSLHPPRCFTCFLSQMQLQRTRPWFMKRKAQCSHGDLSLSLSLSKTHTHTHTHTLHACSFIPLQTMSICVCVTSTHALSLSDSQRGDGCHTAQRFLWVSKNRKRGRMMERLRGGRGREILREILNFEMRREP